jgi:colicin import membrane protein
MRLDNSMAWFWSILLHGCLALGIILSAELKFHPSLPSDLGPSIDAVAVDSQVLKNLQSRKQAQADAAQRKAEELARAQEREKARAEAQAKAEAQARADAQAKAEAQAQAKVQAAAQLKAADLKAAQLKAAQAEQLAKTRAASQAAAQAAKARAQAEQEQADAAKTAAHAQDQKLRAQRESELRRQLAEEEKIAALQAGPLQKSYIASIQNRITRAWIKPASARSGIVCSIDVTQIAGGEVTKVHVTNCNGDEAVRQSIENAVFRASPLPEPPDPALFQRNLTLVFKPNE